MRNFQRLPKYLLAGLIIAIVAMLVRSAGGFQLSVGDPFRDEATSATVDSALSPSGQQTNQATVDLSDIRDIAEAMGTDDLDHVRRHLEIQAEIDTLRDQLRAELPRSIAAVGLDALPETRVYVYVTREGVERATELVEQSPWAEITEVVEVELSWNDLVALQQSVHNVLAAQKIRYVSGAIDFRENQIVIGATADQFDQVHSTIQDYFPNQRVKVVESPMIERLLP